MPCGITYSLLVRNCCRSWLCSMGQQRSILESYVCLAFTNSATTDSVSHNSLLISIAKAFGLPLHDSLLALDILPWIADCTLEDAPKQTYNSGTVSMLKSWHSALCLPASPEHPSLPSMQIQAGHLSFPLLFWDYPTRFSVPLSGPVSFIMWQVSRLASHILVNIWHQYLLQCFADQQGNQLYQEL